MASFKASTLLLLGSLFVCPTYGFLCQIRVLRFLPWCNDDGTSNLICWVDIFDILPKCQGETTTSTHTIDLNGVDIETTFSDEPDGSVSVDITDVGSVAISSTELIFQTADENGGVTPSFTVPFPQMATPTPEMAKQLTEYLVRQLDAAVDASAEMEGGRRLDSPGCDLFPDAPCNLGCCAVHDQCFAENGCNALSWARSICEPTLAAGIFGLISLGPIGSIACTASLFFISGECSQCNSAAVGCIAAGCSGLTEPDNESCYDNKCNVFFVCEGDCPVFSLEDEACCGCQTAGSTCGAPATCGNGVCDFGESNANCFVDCAFNDCPNPGEFMCGEDCVDPANDPNNCGACGVRCPEGADCVLRSCSASIGITWETETMAGGEWIITNDGKTIRFAIEDSANCGGTNDLTQTGTATASIILSEQFALTLEIIGIAELEDAGFERMDVSLNGELVVSATSNNDDLECAMGPATFSTIVPPPYILPVGEHVFQIDFTTNDGLYHVDAFYELNLIFAPFSP